MADEKALWYVVHTYSGYENKVANDLVKTVENNGMGDLIQEVTVPIEEVVEIRNGKPHTIQHKLFPGYVLVKMIKTPYRFKIRATSSEEICWCVISFSKISAAASSGTPE